MKKKIIYLILIPCLFLVSCSKEELKPTRFKVSEILYSYFDSNQPNNNMPAQRDVYQYSIDGKLTNYYIYGYDSIGVETYYGGATIEYSSGQIIEKSYNEYNQLESTKTMTLGTNGFVSYAETYDSLGIMTDNCSYTYNADGYLIKTESNSGWWSGLSDTIWITSNSITNYEIENGNTIKEIYQYTTSLGYNSTDTYDNKFDPNLSNPFSSTSVLVKDGFPSVDVGFYGRPNKSFLIEQAEYTPGSDIYYYKLKYTIDGNGNIEKLIYTGYDAQGNNNGYILNFKYTTTN
jgi:hypothetical protein